MKRLHFLAGLFGFSAAAKAQILIESGRAFTNNTCPLCGVLAIPFYRPAVADIGAALNNCKPAGRNAEGGRDLICATVKAEPYGPTERITRCRNCNNAFYQDAEK